MTTMTSKGQVTVPKKLRDALGLKPGSEVVFEYEGNGRAIIRRAGRARPAKGPFARLRGSLKSDMSTDEVMALLRGD